MEKNHSISLTEERCIGCTDCIKRCPTEAIRVRNGKAQIIDNRCIDCGTCIRVCGQRAKRATTDPLSIIDKFKYKVAIPAPTLYGQFRRTQDINTLLTAVKRLGFDDVFEVSRAAELVTAISKDIIERGSLSKPVISSACPAIVNLIKMKFPSLIENILPIISPMEAAAASVKKYLTEEVGMDEADIGVFFISPCGAKATNVRNPVGISKSWVDGVISINDIYVRLRGIIKTITEPEPLAQSTASGIDWAITGGEGRGLSIDNAIWVDGVENVMNVLEELENGQLMEVDFIEALACIGGCVGGSLGIKNSFVAKNILEKAQRNILSYSEEQKRKINYPRTDFGFVFTERIEPEPVLSLDADMAKALEKLERANEIFDRLPHIDCGSCGAPTCMALAEDIVQGEAVEEDCIFMLREKVRALAESMVSLSQKLPPSLDSHKDSHNKSDRKG